MKYSNHKFHAYERDIPFVGVIANSQVVQNLYNLAKGSSAYSLAVELSNRLHISIDINEGGSSWLMTRGCIMAASSESIEQKDRM